MIKKLIEKTKTGLKNLFKNQDEEHYIMEFKLAVKDFEYLKEEAEAQVKEVSKKMLKIGLD